MGSSIDLARIGNYVSGEELHEKRCQVTDLLHRQNLNFPGAQPVSFGKRHIAELQRADYFMCEKTDGVRCLLYLTHIYLRENQPPTEAQFLIDRKNDYYYIPNETLHLPLQNDRQGYHLGTLLDGELVRQKFKNGQERLAYLIFDCLAIDLEDVTDKPFDKRLARVNEYIVKPLKQFAKQFPDDVAAQPFQVEMKAMEFPYAMEMMFRERIPNLPHGNDGLIFTCKGTPYVAGTDQHILKWKPPHENTIDFRLLLGDFPLIENGDGEYEDWDAMPQFDLYAFHGGKKYERWDALYVTESEWAAMKRMNQQLDGRIVECYRDKDGKWRPKIEQDGSPRFRDDKTDGNHISVVESVLETIDDGVTEQDLIFAAKDIRETYKKRQKIQEEEMRRAMEAEKKRRAQEEEMKRRASEMKLEEDDGPTYED